MNTRPLFSRYRLYLIGIGALTSVALLLRTLALFLSFDIDIGYFSGGFLVYALYVIEVLAVVGSFSLLFFIRKGELPVTPAPLSKAGLIGTGLCTLAFAATAVFLLTQINTLPCPPIFTTLAAICSGLGAVYFILLFLGKTDVAPLLGYGVILAAALLLSVTYFDRYTQMNAPHKVGLHLCLLAIMTFMLYELRAMIGRAMPRALCVTSALCFFFCAVVGVSDIIAFIGGVFTDFLYLIIDLLATGFALYIGSRAVGDLMQAAPDAAAETTSDDAAA
jgi:hypothetical protein